MFSTGNQVILIDEDLKLNFTATFTEAICPFKISVKQSFIERTKLKASLTRITEDQEDGDPNDGPPSQIAAAVAKYWAEEYDWAKIEAGINERLQQFTTVIRAAPTATHPYAADVPLHFVHHRSARPDAIPLLFVHGWPGSFLEVEHIIEPLTNPPAAAQPAFHVVAPSIPGYGFSPAPRRPGFGYRQAGAMFHALMAKLGYDKYVFQGGDAGDFINRYAAVDFPSSVVSGLSNFWVVPPNEQDRLRYVNKETSEDENYVISHYDKFINSNWSYGQLHQTKPLRLAIGLNDSPVGLAMWIYDGLRGGVADASIWTPELIITWTMMHWIIGPYGAFSLYKNGALDGSITTQGIGLNMPFVHQPVAVSLFPYDLWYRTPLEWTKRGGNVKQYKVHERGGHFAAFDAPDLLIEDIRQFFGDWKLAGTEVFLPGEGAGTC